MHKIQFVILLSLAICGYAGSQPPPAFAPDVQAFIESADDCEHFSGEWDSDLSLERQKEIERAVALSCHSAKQQQAALRIKYRGHAEIEKKLAEYDF